jgi:hypothetical protein
MASITLPVFFAAVYASHGHISVSYRAICPERRLRSTQFALYLHEPSTSIRVYPRCCLLCPDPRCLGVGSTAIITSNATKLLGTIDIILEGYQHQAVQALADSDWSRGNSAVSKPSPTDGFDTMKRFESVIA